MLEPKPLENAQEIVNKKLFYNKALDYMSFNKAYKLIREQVPISKSTLLRISRGEGHEYPIKHQLNVIELDGRMFVQKDDINSFIEAYKEADALIHNPDEYISVEDYAKQIGKSERTVQRLIKKDNLQTTMFKKHLYIKKMR